MPRKRMLYSDYPSQVVAAMGSAEDIADCRAHFTGFLFSVVDTSQTGSRYSFQYHVSHAAQVVEGAASHLVHLEGNNDDEET